MVEWVRNVVAEKHICDSGCKIVDLEGTDVLISDIDLAKSRLYQNRIDMSYVDESTVEGYREAFELGKPFHMLVLKKEKSKYVIIDGNHRGEAFLRSAIPEKPLSIKAYVVTGTDSSIHKLCNSINKINGKQLSDQESSALLESHLAIYPDADVEQLSRLFSMARSTVSKRKRCLCTGAQLAEMGITGLPRGVVEALSTVSDNENVLKCAGTVARDYALTKSETQEMTKAIRTKRTEGTQCNAAKAFATSLKGDRPGHINQKLAVKDGLMRRIAALISYLNKYPSTESLQLTAKEHLQHAQHQKDNLVSLLKKVFKG